MKVLIFCGALILLVSVFSVSVIWDEQDNSNTETSQTTRHYVYRNIDGAPPKCAETFTGLGTVCNTNPIIVELSQLLQDGYSWRKIVRYMINDCLVRGGKEYACDDFFYKNLSPLITYNLQHGIPTRR